MAEATYNREGFPPDDRLDWATLVPLIGTVTAALVRYDTRLQAIPNPDIFLAPLSTREAVLSSRIEGTQATLDEVLEFEADERSAPAERRDDILEVLNYRRAMWTAERLLEELPLSLRVLREAHRVLLSGVRGRNRAPGEFRAVQNWIGPPGVGLEAARYVPPPPDVVPEAMSRWERYIHAEAPDRLVQLAVLHAEFEAIHPFLDGNGRLGRLFVPLFLWQKGLIHQPRFYLSAYLEAHREAYYEGLLAVSRDDDWTGWCLFFLEAIRAQAEENTRRLEAILALYEEMKERVPRLTRSRYAIQAIDWLFRRPVFTTSTYLGEAGIPEPAARRILRELRKEGIVREIRAASGRRPALFAFSRLLRIAEGGDSA